jgi:rare lipoprotein A
LTHKTILAVTFIISSIFIFASSYADAQTWTGGASFYRARTSMGCAHRYLPFGTRLRVTNLRNGKAVMLTVNDRGPFIRGRIVDVSTQAASILGFRRAGVVPVRVETMGSHFAAN